MSSLSVGMYKWIVYYGGERFIGYYKIVDKR